MPATTYSGESLWKDVDCLWQDADFLFGSPAVVVAPNVDAALPLGPARPVMKEE